MTPIVLSKQEWVIMTTIWKLDKPVCYHDILKARPDLNRNTLLAVLNKLQQYGMIQISGYSYHNTSLTRQFAASIRPDTYLSQFFKLEDYPIQIEGFLAECSCPEILTRIRDAAQARLSQLKKD